MNRYNVLTETPPRDAYSPFKTSFLVYRNQKYTTVPTDEIAFFYIRNDCTCIRRFDGQEYCLTQSLLQVAEAVAPRQFFRVNRRYLVNFKAIKEVEHHFNRKLLVQLMLPTPELLLINKERTQSFLTWMENR